MSVISPCNYCCSNCVVYREQKCLGCIKQSQKTKAMGRVFCNISQCAIERNMATCSDCKDYPCEKYRNGIYAESFIKWIKEKLKEKPSS